MKKILKNSLFANTRENIGEKTPYIESEAILDYFNVKLFFAVDSLIIKKTLFLLKYKILSFMNFIFFLIKILYD